MSFLQEFNLEQIRSLLLTAHQQPPKPIERRLYYDSEGRVVTYTCEDLPGNYIVVTPEQFAEARPDVIVRDGKIIYTHKLSHVSKMVRTSLVYGRPTSQWDINILVEPTDPDRAYWRLQDNEVR